MCQGYVRVYRGVKKKAANSSKTIGKMRGAKRHQNPIAQQEKKEKSF